VTREAGRTALAFAVLGAVGAAMLAWTWGTWPNAIVDFGRELYVPWRLSEGEVLYRDLAWFNGPLSPAWNALLFAVLGPGLRVLVLANLACVVLLVVVLYALIARVADRLAAFTACLVFLVLFAFCRVDAVGNDNYLTPYSHELTHGLLLSLLALLVFARGRTRPRLAACASGLLLGMVALTKPELFVAAAAALACAFVLEHAGGRRASSSLLAVAGLLAAATLLPAALSVGLLSLSMPAGDALRGTLGAWPAIFSSDVTSQYFYRATLGIVGVSDNLRSLFEWSLAWAGVVLPITLAGLRIRPRPDAPRSRTAAWLADSGVLVGTAALVLLFAGPSGLFAPSWPELLRPLPFALAALTAGSALLALRGSGRDDGAAVRTALLVLSTLLLAKVVLRVRLDQYGFALAMPGTALALAALVCWLPRFVGMRGGDARLVRAALIGVVVAVVISLLPVIAFRIEERSATLGAGRDAFLAEPGIARVLQPLLDELETHPAEATLAVLPEGVMINYLARRVNGTGYVNFMPPELLMFGEDRILEAFRAHPPDLVVIAHKDTREYGVGFFGRGYGRELHRFVSQHYQPVARFGDPPLAATSRFGAILYERRARSATDSAAD
jgi:hypothetical protein